MPWLVYLVLVVFGQHDSSYLRGDGYYYVSTAISLWQDHDLDLSNQLPGELQQHRGHFSRDIEGRPVPKHPILLPVVSLPFVALGPNGPLLFNLLQLMAIVGLLYRVARYVARPWPAALGVALTGCATILPHYAWNYSGDLVSVLFVLAGLVCLLRVGEGAGQVSWALWAGGLLGLGAVSKLPHLIALATAPLLTSSWRSRACLVVGALVPLGLFAALNQHLFGAPWVVSYARIADVREGEWTLRSQVEDLDQSVAAGAWAQRTDAELGIVTTTPITLVSFLLLPLVPSSRRRLSLWVGIVTVVLFLFYSRYSLWDVSDYGNRFLLLPVALGIVGLVGGLQRAWEGYGSETPDRGRLDH